MQRLTKSCMRGLALALLLVVSAAAADAAGGAPAGGRLLVLNKAGGTLMVFEAPSSRLIGEVRVGREPHEVAASPDGGKAYVSDFEGRAVSIVDLRSLSLLKTIGSDGFDRPHGLHVSRDGRRVLVTSEGSHRLFLIDGERDVVDRALTTTQEGAHMLAVGRGGDRVYVANRISGSVTAANAYNLTIRDHVPLAGGPEGIAATPDGRWVLVALQHTDEVVFLDPGSLRERHRIAVGRTPVRIAVTPDGDTALVSNRGTGDVTVLDLRRPGTTESIAVGDRPGGVVTDATGKRAWVCSNGSDDVAILSLTDLRVVGRIPAGDEPDGIAFARTPAPLNTKGGPGRSADTKSRPRGGS